MVTLGDMQGVEMGDRFEPNTKIFGMKYRKQSNSGLFTEELENKQNI